MPAIAKPCAGHFSDDTVTALLADRDHAQWLMHACMQCSQQVGAHIEKGKWVPEAHWPSVRYVPRAKRAEKRVPAPTA